VNKIKYSVDNMQMQLKNMETRFNLRWFAGIVLYYKRYLWEIVMAAFCFQTMGLVIPLCTQVIIDKVIVNKGMVTLNVLALGMVLVVVFQLAMDVIRRYLFSHTTNKIDVLLGTRLFQHIMKLPMEFFMKRRVGNLLMKIYALENIREFLTKTAITTCIDICFSLIFFAVMFYYSFPLAVIALVAVPVQIIINIFGAPRYQKRLEESWNVEARSHAFMIEAIQGIQTVKALSLEPRFRYRWENMLSGNVQKNLACTQFGVAMNESVDMVQQLVKYLIIWFGGVMVIDGSVTIGQFIAFQMLSNQAAVPILRIAQICQSFQQMRLSLERMGDIISSAIEKGWANNGIQLEKIYGGIKFEKVSFNYDIESSVALDHVSLEIEPGMCIGLVGRSGSGKSTLTKLINRLYCPTEGQIFLDGEKLENMDLVWLRQRIGVVLQENYLFTGTIRENIAYGRTEASFEQIEAAARLAGAHDFIMDLPDGYDAYIEENGGNLSGGQRQRIAIARVLLQDPQILIFDEATSALDYASERVIMENMKKMASGRTTLIIAHRLANVKHCDRIVVMDHGKIVELGNHEELLRQGGVYSDLWQYQKEKSNVQ